MTAAAPAPGPSAPARPLLTPAVRRLWRDSETLQLGRARGRAVVLAGVDPGVRTALGLLDGTRDAGAWTAEADARGCAPGRSAALLALLCGAGLVEDAAQPPPAPLLPREERDRLSPDAASLSLVSGGCPSVPLARRVRADVLVVGAGRVGAPLAVLLAAAGVGGVAVQDDAVVRPTDVGAGGLLPEDVGRRREAAVAARVRAVAPGVRDDPARVPDLVVLAPPGPLPDGTAAALVRQGTPHLLAEVSEQVGTVGPLVLPGRSACLHCLDLTRTDLDPDWPALAAQLSQPRPGPAPCDAALAVQVAATAAQQVLAAVDELVRPAAVGGTLELVLPDYRWRRRSWPAHPDCDCGAAGRRPPSGPTLSR